MFKTILNHKSKTVTFAAGILAASTLINGFLALFRDRLLAARFGAGESLDIYFAAFRIPDFIYAVLVAGGMISVFLPIFSENFLDKKEKAWQFTNNILNCFLILLVFLCSALIIFAPFLIKFITPGFSEKSKALTVSLTRIMLLSPFFFVLSSVFSGVLHYFNRFLIYSLAPILYTLGIIAGILFFVPLWGIWGLAFGVVLGSFLHLLVQIPSAVLAGFRYKPFLNFKSQNLWKVFKLMIPRTIGAAARHINLIVITALASTLISGSIAIFNFSYNLQKFPIGLIGVSFGAAAFPSLSKTYSSGKKKDFIRNFFSVFRQIIFLIIPISVFVFILRAQLVRLILGTGEFGWLDTRLTAACLGLFSFGIFAFCLVSFLTRAFHAFQDTKTPVIIAVASIILNVLLIFLFVWILGFSNIFQKFMRSLLDLQGIGNMRVVGLPLAFSLSGIFNFIFLYIFLQNKIKIFGFKAKDLLKKEKIKLYHSLRKILISTCLMIIFTYFFLQVGVFFVNMKTFLGIFLQTALASLIGVLTYIFMSYLFHSPELRTIKSSIIDQFNPKS